MTTAAYQRLLAFIVAERRMREIVFRNQPMKIDKKLAECDAAFADLEILRQAANVRTDRTPEHTQIGLF
jgi:hypothetical protein